MSGPLAGAIESVAMKPPLDRGALAREISSLANGNQPTALTNIRVTEPIASHARRIAITGAPGAGKSTLCGHLARLRASDRRYAILAVDPSSPRSGGAILGDRIRIDELDGTADLYVRSLASRSSHDGLADNLPAILETLDRHGFDEVLLETVGVGQADYAVRILVDTVVLVLHPESGDIVQAMKAGIMEMADLFVVNKSDLPAADKCAGDIKRILSLTQRTSDDWTPRVLNTSSKDPASIARLSESIDAHEAWRTSSPRRIDRTRAMQRYVLQRALDRSIADAIGRLPAELYGRALNEQFEWVVTQVRPPVER